MTTYFQQLVDDVWMEVVKPIPSDRDIDLTVLRNRVEAGRRSGGNVYTASELFDLLDAARGGDPDAMVPAELLIGAVSLLLHGGIRRDQVIPLSTEIAHELVTLASSAESPLIPQQPGSEEQLIA
jgi:hypothetical protein